MLRAPIQAYRNSLIRLVDGSRRAALWVIICAILASAGLLYYTVTHLSLDTDTTNMLDPELPFRKLKLDLERAFPQFDDVIAVVIDAATATVADEAANALAGKIRQSALFHSVYQPGQGPFFERNGLLYLDTAELEKVDKRLTEAEPFLGTLSTDPSLRGLFSVLQKSLDQELSAEQRRLLTRIMNSLGHTIEEQLAGRATRISWHEDLLGQTDAGGKGHRRFILVQPRLDFASLQSAGDAIKALRNFAKGVRAGARQGVRIRLTGSVAMADEELGTVSKGAALATLLSFSLVSALLLLGLGSPRLVASVLITLCVGLVWTAAFATVAIGHLNLISVCFAVLFIGLGVDFGIQFGMRYREEIDAGHNHAAALTRTSSGLGGALTLAASAAAISFFSFIPTGYQGLAELGLIAGAGMFMALLASLTVLPALLTLIPIRPRKQAGVGGILAKWKIRLQHFRRIILWASAVVAVGAVTLLPRADFDLDPVSLKDPSTESVSTFLDLTKDPHSTPYRVSILTDNLAEAEKLASRLSHAEGVEEVVTLMSYVPEDQDEKLLTIDDMALVLQPLVMPAEQVSPPSTAEQVRALDSFQDTLNHVSPALPTTPLSRSMTQLDHQLDRLQEAPGWPDRTLADLEQRLLANLSKRLDKLRTLLMAREVTLEDLPADLRSRYLAPDGRTRVEVFAQDDLRDSQALRDFVRKIKKVAPAATDVAVAMVEGADYVILACLQATVTTLLIIFFLLLVVLRSLRDTLLVLLPLGLAMILTIASSILLHVPLNLANIVALPLLLGLGIAFGIYFVLRKRSGLATDDLFHSSTPRAVLFSALTTIASFGTLAFSNHRGLSSIGALLALAVSLALICALVVLPALITELEFRKR